MNSFVLLSIVLAASSMALAASIYIPGAPSFEDMDHGSTRQLNISSALTGAIGSGAGNIPLFGNFLQNPVSNFLQRPLSSGLSFITGGLVDRMGGFNSFGNGGFEQWSPMFWGRSEPLADVHQQPQAVYVFQ